MKKHMRGVAPAVQLRQLSVRRGSFALGVTKLDLRPGEITCVVGPNGCGKTTLLLSILGLLPHDGTCLVNGKRYDGSDPHVKATIGFIPDDPELLFAELTAKEQWSVTASVAAQARGNGAARKQYMQRAEELAATLGFDAPPQLAREYSHGMRKKTQLIQALLSEPSVIIVDELRNGLDPLAIHQTERIMREECDRGAAVCAATHDLWWAERFADYIVIMDKGHIAAEGTVIQLLEPGDRDLESAFYRIIGADV